MPNSVVTIKDAAGNNIPIDTRTGPDGDHRQTFMPGTADNAFRYVIAATTSNTQLLAARNDRLAIVVFNNSTAVLRFSFASAATATDFTVALPPMSYYEAPCPWSGEIYGLWDAVNGNALVTEFI